MSGGEASAPADATPPDFCARRSSLEVFPVCPRRFPLFALSLFLALLLVPSRALAYDFIPKGLVYSADLDGSRYGAVAVAANQFDAACYALGKEPASISTSIRSKLSDPNYGGRFYDFSQAFYTQGWPLEEVPEWLPIYVWGSLEWSDLLLSDYQSVWYVTCTQSLRSGALADFLAVLNGQDLGGGGSSGGTDVSSSFPSQFTLNTVFGVYANNDNWSGFVTPSGTQYYKFYNSSAMGSYLSSRGLSYFYVFNAPFHRRTGRGKSEGSNQLLYASASPITFQIVADSGSIPYLTFNASSDSAIWFVQYSGDEGFSTFTPNLSGTVTNWNGSFSFSNVGTSYTFTGTRRNGSYTEYITYCNSNGVGAYVPPAGTWPEPSSPAAPVEPTFPDPSTPTVLPDPVVTEPTVTWPSPTITIDPDPVPGTTPTGLDYTELLTRINDNLISIDSFSRALNSNLNSLRSDLVNEFDGVVSGLRNVYTYLQHMDSVLERHCIHLQNKMEDVSVDIQNKMRDLVHWLAEQLDFDSESSGNSDLFGILSTINDKLGGGTYEPNPLRDENAYYEWLDDLWDRFLLGDNWQSSASSMSQSFGQLTSRFPFSVPWDIVALFRLFVHDPVTPVFDLPLYYSSEDSATVRVDLSAWDGVASVVRPLVFVIFALKLALLSRHLLAGFGADKGGL